jgi:hypothetical protein
MPSNENLARHFINQYDTNKDGALDRDEVAHWVAENDSLEKQQRSATSEAPEADVDEKLDGMMMMLDEDKDDVGSFAELLKFVQKMHDMGGRTDRLPNGGTNDNARDARRKKKRKQAKKAKRASSSHIDEL